MRCGRMFCTESAGSGTAMDLFEETVLIFLRMCIILIETGIVRKGWNGKNSRLCLVFVRGKVRCNATRSRSGTKKRMDSTDPVWIGKRTGGGRWCMQNRFRQIGETGQENTKETFFDSMLRMQNRYDVIDEEGGNV